MALVTIKNVPNGKAVFKLTGAGTATINTSSVAFSTDEKVDAFNISRIAWSTNDSITLARTSGTVDELYYSGDWNFMEKGFVENENNTETLTITIAGAGTVYLEVNKHIIGY